MPAPFDKVAIIGLGLIGSSIARATREAMPGLQLSGFDAEDGIRDRARGLQLVDQLPDDAAEAVDNADLVILCVPVGAMGAAAAAIAPSLKPAAIITDVGSSKASVAETLRQALPGATIIPGHPIAGTENSGPEAGFATLFKGRWSILTPAADAPMHAIEKLTAFWSALGAKVECMDPRQHDLTLAVTSHLPHLIAYTIVGTARELENVTEGEVIKYSAGGFRDFTRIAASNPTMWRDIFLSNKEAVLDVLDRFRGDLAGLEQAIRDDDGATLHDWFSRTRAIRRAIIDQGQDVAAADFGRASSPAQPKG
ncbi:prephenate/arogenate dehydrogenase family protein [Sphingomonas piscis]|uniref:prephenate dehydrogenase n=1 Tax=Sphingomonas piscis TaxID=2714943 RepID=A0A6G7YPB2_9SPHN|nr:prephenate/arogenate dehydrogenase family protein [Sphingomonas piscis]QIK78580.1 prephenate/arogenate dehydrogenase family protein [Sphingomonas piscis]